MAAGLAVLMSAQLALPGNYYLPRSYVGSQHVGLRYHEQLRYELKTRSSMAEVAFDKVVVSAPATEAGIEVDVNKTLAELPRLKWTDRIVPLKPLYMALRKKSVKPVMRIDEAKLRAFSAKASQKHYKTPVAASAAITEGRLVLTEDIPGRSFDAAAVAQALARSNPFSTEPVRAEPTVVPAATVRQELVPLEKAFAAKTAVPLRITYGGITTTVSQDELRKSLKVIHSQPDDVWKLGFDTASVDARIQTWANEYNMSPGTTQISYVDDVEVSRRTGASGRALDAGGIRQQFDRWLEAPSEAPVALASVVLPPKVVATRTYTFSSAQLQQRLNAWISRNPGTYQVAIRELGGRGREASHNVAQQTVMASTYKIFLAFVAYRQAENGALRLDATLPGGKPIGSCIESMIVASENTCAVELGRHIGWAEVDRVIAAAGFEGTVLNNYDSAGNLSGNKLVNATQQARFLAQLSAGSLISSAHTDQLLGFMKRQGYREGIPAGSRGSVVADKVGFLDNYLHDVGIVYGSKSTYALVIMSSGSSWKNIQDLSAAVYDFMSQ
jgi:beta-lactamase class A